MKIVFTIEQVNEILSILDKMPHMYSRPLIDGIKGVADQQIAEQQAPKDEPKDEDSTTQD